MYGSLFEKPKLPTRARTSVDIKKKGTPEIGPVALTFAVPSPGCWASILFIVSYLPLRSLSWSGSKLRMYRTESKVPELTFLSVTVF